MLNRPWKAIARPQAWSATTWVAVSLVVLCTAATVVVGIGLFAITGEPPEFNNR